MNRNLTRREANRLLVLLATSLQGMALFAPAVTLAGRVGRFLGKGARTMDLPTPAMHGDMSLERAVKQRRTVRSFSGDPIAMEELSQILWAAQGITEERGFKRAAPSAGALYPADIYVVAGEKGVEGLAGGVYHYEPADNRLGKRVEGDSRNALAEASLRQMWMAGAPVCIVVTVEYDRITVKYGDRGIRYAHIEVGHIGQNIFLQCQTLGLSAGIVGAFKDREVAKVAGLFRNHEPLIIMPIGRQG